MNIALGEGLKRFSLFPFVDDEIATSLLIHECKVLVVLAASNCILILRALIIICSEEISLLFNAC